jgi:putative redox protein
MFCYRFAAGYAAMTLPRVCYPDLRRYESLSNQGGKAIVHFAGKDLFIGISPSGHAVTLDTDRERNSAPSPVEMLLVALGACTGVDVVGILEKKRIEVVGYRIELSGVRRDEHPRAFTRIDVKHIIKGKNVPEKAVAQAIELSDQKYCSVAATFRPTVEIVSSYEIIQAE